MQSAIHHFAGGDVGGVMNVSGAAVLKSSRNQAAAQKFLAFLVSKPAQELVSKLNITFEYPLAAGVAANPMLKPAAELQPPSLTLEADRRRPRRRRAVERGGPDLMSQAASLNAAAARLRLWPRAGQPRARARRRLDRRRCVRRRARSAADPGHDRSGGRRRPRKARLDLLIRPLVGRLLVNTVGLVVAASVTCAVIGTATAWLVERTDLPGRKVWARARRRATGDSAIHLELCLGLAQQWAAGLRRRASGGDVRLLSARLSAGRRGAARPRSGARGDGAVAGSWAVGMFLPGRRAATAPGALRRRIAGRARCPDRVRRLCAPALPHLHHRALRPVPDRTGRAGILAAGARAHRSLSHLRGRGTEDARPGALRARRLRRPSRRRARASRMDPAAGAGGVRRR